ncbi:hypothetical protein AVEN_212419-1 [Araneus ventricosus]|uniref:Retrovirus-related Pol polyprotein from transposon TNT 1-94-like beta-barrel domain-containing protein n=1 Tax=Araneus ventricosus TaxID=182803 RepID=A0A4Y2TLA3_ARAVE|nr:hypothetical protein AVEN_212419-1 [Araneus ventricosus]
MRKVHRNATSKERSNTNRVFTESANEKNLCENIWILNSGASYHMVKDRIWFEKIIPGTKDIYLAGKTYLGETKVETRSIDSLLETTPDINEIDYKTKVSHFEISAEPVTNETYSFPFQTQTSHDATNTMGDESENSDD